MVSIDPPELRLEYLKFDSKGMPPASSYRKSLTAVGIEMKVTSRVKETNFDSSRQNKIVCASDIANAFAREEQLN